MADDLTWQARGIETALREAGHLKGTDLRTWAVAQHKASSSWARVADTVRDLTGTYVSERSLRNWFGGEPDQGDTP
jgi:hypothetical protein